jgi:HEAT repeat protein
MKTHLALALVLHLVPVSAQAANSSPEVTPPQAPAAKAKESHRLPTLDEIQPDARGWFVGWGLPSDPESLGEGMDSTTRRILRLPDPLADTVEAEAEAILLGYQADRRFDKAMGHLAALWVRASRAAGEFDARGLERVHRLRYQLLAAAGKWEPFDHVEGPSPSPELIRLLIPRVVILESNAKGKAMLTAFEASPAMVALREKAQAERGTVAGPRSADEAAIAAYVDEHYGTAGPELRELAASALFMRDAARLRSMGPKAAGVVASCVLAQLAGPADEDFWHSREQTFSFELLPQIDEARALALYVDWFAAASTTWRVQVFDACSPRRLRWLPGSPTTTDEERTGTKLWDPTWLKLIELFLEDPTLAANGLERISQLAEMDGLSPELAFSLGALLREGDRALAGTVLGVLDVHARVPSAIPALVQGTRSASEDIRRVCAWRLVEWGAFDEARALAAKADPELRRAAARAMGKLEVTYNTLSGRSLQGGRREPMSVQDLRRIEALLADPEPAVREEMEAVVTGWLGRSRRDFVIAEGTLGEWVHALDPRLRRVALERIPADDSESAASWIRDLMADSDPAVRQAMVDRWIRVNPWTEDQRILVLSAAVVDPDPAVRAAADHHLWALPGGPERDVDDLQQDRVLAVVLPLRQTVTPTTPLLELDPNATWADFARGWQIDPAETPFLLEFGIDFGLVDLVAQQLEVLMLAAVPDFKQNSYGGFIGTQLRNPSAGVGPLRSLTVERRAELRMLHFGVRKWIGPPGLSESISQFLWRAVVNPTPDLELIALALADKEANPAWLRRALGDPRLADALDPIKKRVYFDPSYGLEVRAAAGRNLPLEKLEGGIAVFWELFDMARRAGPDALHHAALLAGSTDVANDLLRQAFPRLETPEAKGIFADGCFRPNKAGAQAAAIMVLEELLPVEDLPAEAGQCRYEVLEAFIGNVPDEEVERLIVQAALQLDDPGAAVEVMESAPRESFMAALFELLDRGSESPAHLAVYALGNYATNEAYSGLRDRLPRVSSELRQTIIESLERMKKMRELLSGLDDSPLPDRGQAIAELVELLEAELPAARAAAARGLGRFGAPEALPRLIRMLTTEKDPAVLEAVEAAIEMLTSAEAPLQE